MRKVKLAIARRIVGAMLAAGLIGGTHAAVLTVNTTADNTTVDGRCSLREAITAADAGAGTADCPAAGVWGSDDAIRFNIPVLSDPGCSFATGACTIAITGSALPDVTRTGLTIDGYTQPGAKANTNPLMQANNAKILVELDGTGLPNHAPGLSLNASGMTVRGLSIFGAWNLNGIAMWGTAQGITIAGNFLGLRANGVTAGLMGFGVFDYQSRGGHTIGGPNPADANVVGALSGGITLQRSSSNTIQGNLIGTDASGTQALYIGPIFGKGVYVYGYDGGLAVNNKIDGNRIAGVTDSGIALIGASGTTVSNNVIGVAVGGALLGNGVGILLSSKDATTNTTNTLVLDNIIAGSHHSGIGVSCYGGPCPYGNRLDRNEIYGNQGLGIDLGADGPTANDAPANLDADTGANGLQNYPVIQSATVNGTGGVDIAYTLDSHASRYHHISAYASDSCAVGTEQGRYLSGPALDWQTDAAGHLAQTFSYGSMPTGWAVGQWVTLLAVDAWSGDTSEFSPCVQIAAPTMPRAPTLLRLVPGNHLIRVLFAPPTSDGGSPITSYTATCRNGAATYSATAATSPISVVGLDNGTTYSCSVHASNDLGASAESAASSRMVRPPSPLSVLTTVLGD